MINYDYSKCMQCAGCAAVCPANAITIYETFIELDKKLCTKCKSCIKICPTGALK